MTVARQPQTSLEVGRGSAFNRWVIVLAAGDGERARSVTRDAGGAAIPKQYWAPRGSESMLVWALRRAGRLVPPTHIVTVVAAHHRAWWRFMLPGEGSLVVQPQNRGTAAGILLPLIHILRRDPTARIAILPADHYVGHEEALRLTFARAFETLEGTRRVVLLGMSPDGPDPSYGWIEGGAEDKDGTRPILSFQEKPGPARARSLYRRDAYWNSFMLAAHGRSLLSMYEIAAPALLRSILGVTLEDVDPILIDHRDERDLDNAYERLPHLDFSRDLLEGLARRLRLLVVPPCGWTDLGTPDRIARWLEREVAPVRERELAFVR